MTSKEAGHVIGRINAIWPAKNSATTAYYAEWIAFLESYELTHGDRTLDMLRAESSWPPSMADFRKTYLIVSTAPEQPRAALPGEVAQHITLLDRFGEDQDSWVFCWQCDMALTLEERATDALFDRLRGLHHARCPRPGTAPIMPADQRAKRAEWLSRTQA
jgi:hypothetical protein